MALITEGRYASDWLKSESHISRFSREQIVVVTGSGRVQSGTVLGKVTATGKYKPVTVGATDGSQTAAGILLVTVDATSADAKGVLIAREAVVVAQGLLYGADVDTAPKRLAVQNQLRALNPPILVREGA